MPGLKSVKQAKKSVSTNKPSKPPLVLIDGSHFCFWRFTATKAWYSKHSGLGNEEDCHIEHDIFKEKFTKHFRDSVEKIKKLFKTQDLIWCRDAPRQDLWRMPLHKEYKGERTITPGVGPFIKYAYNELIPPKQMIRIAGAEADDVLGTICLQEHMSNPDRRIYIVSEDNDFLQLVNDKIQVVNPKKKFKPIELPAHLTNITYLQKKILMGDKSDNISQVAKCGPKTAERLALNPEAFDKEIKANPERWSQYQSNRQLIDFTYIPDEIQTEILQAYKLLRKPHLKLTLQRKSST